MNLQNKIFIGLLITILAGSASVAFAGSKKSVTHSYTALQTQFLDAYRVFASHKLPEGTLSTTHAKNYLNALIDMLSARIQSMKYLVEQNTGLTQSDRTLLTVTADQELEALAEFAHALKTSKNDLESTVAAANGMRSFLTLHDRFMRTATGFLGSGNLTATVRQHSDAAAELLLQRAKFTQLGADVSQVSAHLTEHELAIQKAKDLILSSKRRFADVLISDKPSETYEAAHNDLKEASKNIERDNAALLATMRALQELTSGLREAPPIK